MEYTKNYHLPQWVKEDRILMEDFNQAMANIENGLTGAVAGAEAGVRSEIQAITAEQAAAETRGLDRLRRLGYDLCQTAARSISAGAAVGTTKGLVFNELKSAAEYEKCSGFLLPEAGGGQLGPGTTLSLTKLNAVAYDWTEGGEENVSSFRPSTVCFRAPGRGVIKSLTIWLDLEIYVTNCIPRLRAQLFDLDSGTYVYTSERCEVQTLQYGMNSRTVTANIPVEAGRNYRLEVDMQPYAMFSGTYGFGTQSTPKLAGTMTSNPFLSGTITESLNVGKQAVQAIAVVHDTGSGAPVVNVGGKAMTLAETRQAVSANGTPCTEREYYLSGSWSGNVSLTAAFQSQSQDMTVYDVAFYLI